MITLTIVLFFISIIFVNSQSNYFTENGLALLVKLWLEPEPEANQCLKIFK